MDVAVSFACDFSRKRLIRHSGGLFARPTEPYPFMMRRDLLCYIGVCLRLNWNIAHGNNLALYVALVPVQESFPFVLVHDRGDRC